MDERSRRALGDLKQCLIDALNTNNAREVYCFHLFMDVVQTHSLMKYLRNMNHPPLESVIRYLSSKVDYLIEQLATFDIVYDRE